MDDLETYIHYRYMSEFAKKQLAATKDAWLYGYVKSEDDTYKYFILQDTACWNHKYIVVPPKMFYSMVDNYQIKIIDSLHRIRHLYSDEIERHIKRNYDSIKQYYLDSDTHKLIVSDEHYALVERYRKMAAYDDAIAAREREDAEKRERERQEDKRRRELQDRYYDEMESSRYLDELEDAYWGWYNQTHIAGLYKGYD